MTEDVWDPCPWCGEPLSETPWCNWCNWPVPGKWADTIDVARRTTETGKSSWRAAW